VVARIDHSPLDVVAWHGNNAPYKYDLRRFNTIAPSATIIPIRRFCSAAVAQRYRGCGCDRLRDFSAPLAGMEDTFRPPWFHRQRRQRVHGLIEGVTTRGGRLRSGRGVAPQLHERARAGCRDYDKAVAADTSGRCHITDTMAFMFETRTVIGPTRYALQHRSCRAITCSDVAGPEEELRTGLGAAGAARTPAAPEPQRT